MIPDFRQVKFSVIPDFRQVRISVTVPPSRKLGTRIFRNRPVPSRPVPEIRYAPHSSSAHAQVLNEGLGGGARTLRFLSAKLYYNRSLNTEKQILYPRRNKNGQAIGRDPFAGVSLPVSNR